MADDKYAALDAELRKVVEASTVVGTTASPTMLHVWRCKPDGTPTLCCKCGVARGSQRFDVCLAGIVKPTPLIGNVCNS